ncbi:hypothetical protein J5O04_08370 [Corynebacterium hindlerae]|uniref:hypothetical protein n=1 Tax=Corynebacterium hindlerae TaxID=699041 RepID=UPI001AD7A233|nr:hypothetical protein [Corynebacterium hindlerae]QTH60824.1 hypothetical protein J5O04_08370 [Corynebacterium hindlerae]
MTCAWCGTPIEVSGRGRPKKYCSHSCRQRAYEQRNNVAGTAIPAEAVILRPEKASRLKDSLFELRCAAEDVATAASEGADGEEIRQLCEDLVELARSIEKLR